LTTIRFTVFTAIGIQLIDDDIRLDLMMTVFVIIFGALNYIMLFRNSIDTLILLLYETIVMIDNIVIFD